MIISFFLIQSWLKWSIFIFLTQQSQVISIDTIKINQTINIIDKLLFNIEDRWLISKYPNFLESLSLSLTSWNIMKLRYEYKILNQLIKQSSNNTTHKLNEKFIMGFMGSSVTAGKDHYFNESYPMKIESMIKPAFDEIEIELEIRNVALGNNPCLPYDLCS